jgi:hypothetical protein
MPCDAALHPENAEILTEAQTLTSACENVRVAHRPSGRHTMIRDNGSTAPLRRRPCAVTFSRLRTTVHLSENVAPSFDASHLVYQADHRLQAHPRGILPTSKKTPATPPREPFQPAADHQPTAPNSHSQMLSDCAPVIGRLLRPTLCIPPVFDTCKPLTFSWAATRPVAVRDSP